MLEVVVADENGGVSPDSISSSKMGVGEVALDEILVVPSLILIGAADFPTVMS